MKLLRYSLAKMLVLCAACTPLDVANKAGETTYINLPTRTIKASPQLPDTNLGSNAGKTSAGSGTTTSPKPSPTPSPSSTGVPDPHKANWPPGTYVYFDYPSGEYSGIQCDMQITDAPSPSPTAGVIFWSHQFYLQNSTGYIGLQIADGKRQAIFSIWDALGSDTGNPFGGEGVGYQRIIEYDWKPGRKYRVAVKRVSNNTSEAAWSGTITDLTSKVSTYLATHRVPASHGAIKSSVVWTEYATQRTCEVPYTRAEFSDPQVLSKSGFVSAAKASGTYHFNVFSTCALSNFEKLAGQSISLEAGRGVIRKTPQGTQLW